MPGAFLCTALFANMITFRELANEAMDVRFPASRAAGSMKKELSAVPKVFRGWNLRCLVAMRHFG